MPIWVVDPSGTASAPTGGSSAVGIYYENWQARPLLLLGSVEWIGCALAAFGGRLELTLGAIFLGGFAGCLVGMMIPVGTPTPETASSEGAPATSALLTVKPLPGTTAYEVDAGSKSPERTFVKAGLVWREFLTGDTIVQTRTGDGMSEMFSEHVEGDLRSYESWSDGEHLRVEQRMSGDGYKLERAEYETNVAAVSFEDANGDGDWERWESVRNGTNAAFAFERNDDGGWHAHRSAGRVAEKLERLGDGTCLHLIGRDGSIIVRTVSKSYANKVLRRWRFQAFHLVDAQLEIESIKWPRFDDVLWELS